MPYLNVYAAKKDASVVRLARAIAAELPTWSLSRQLMAGLRRQLVYLETYYPDAVKRAREKTGVST